MAAEAARSVCAVHRAQLPEGLPAGVHGGGQGRPHRIEPIRLGEDAERSLIGAEWPEHRYDGEVVSMVFTTIHGGLANRQSVTKEIARAGKAAGIDPTGLATHSGRRTVATALYANGGLDLADVARHVGHADPSTTAGYVRSLGHRPSDTARKAAALLDPSLD